MTKIDVKDKTRKQLNRMTSDEIKILLMLIKVCWNSTTANITEGKYLVQNIFDLNNATEEDWRTFLDYVKTQKR
jgi:hypothetical protein